MINSLLLAIELTILRFDKGLKEMTKTNFISDVDASDHSEDGNSFSVDLNVYPLGSANLNLEMVMGVASL